MRLKQAASFERGCRGESILGAVDITNHALRIQRKRGAACHAQEVENPVLLGDFPLRIAQQRKGETEFLSKAEVGRRPVDANPQNLSSCSFKIGKTILVCRKLLRSAGSIREYVKGQHHVLAGKVAQPNQSPGMVLQLELRGPIAHFQRHLYHSTQRLRLARRRTASFLSLYFFSCARRLHAEWAPLGLSAAPSRSMCRMMPCLSITKVVRFAKPCALFRTPYSADTFRWKSLSRGKVKPFCSAKTRFEGELSTLMPKISVPVF
jgi:hypothetical protein